MPPESALRRMVADLATLHPDDVAAVLQCLDASERKTIEHLLSELSQFGFGKTLARDEGPRFDETRVSPWLVQRINGREGNLTAHTRETLAVCVARLFPPPARTKPRRLGLFLKTRSPEAAP